MSIIRFAKWQIGSRLVPGAILFDWINDSKFIVRRGETGLTGNIYTGLHEFPDMAFLLHFLRPDDLFIDVGANAGSYTILACAAIGSRGYAFEPVPSTFRRLVENIRLNHLEGRVICLNNGIGAEQGRIAFTSDGDTTNHVVASGEYNSNSVNIGLTTLDIALDDERPTLIKIDAEGYEAPVLEGADKTLRKKTLRSVIMELNESANRYGFNESSIIKMMFDHGFRTYSYDPFHRTLTNLTGKNLNSGNTLFIRDEPFVSDRLKNAPMLSIHGKQF